jgi:hypothetical protein
MSERLALEGWVFGVRERLSLPDCPLILRSKMATLLRLPGADEPIGSFLCERSRSTKRMKGGDATSRGSDGAPAG